MTNKYKIYLISDSTGETLDRTFLALQSQFANFNYEKKEYVFIRTNQQIDKIIKECAGKESVIILYTIVDTKLAKFLDTECKKNNIPCFGVLGNLILSFSKLLNNFRNGGFQLVAPQKILFFLPYLNCFIIFKL